MTTRQGRTASCSRVGEAWVAGHGMSTDSLGELSMLWQRLRRRDVFPVRPDQVLRALLGGSRSVSSSEALGSLVRSHAGFADLAEAPAEVHMVATDLLSGTAVFLSSGPVETAVRASAGVPGLFQPVHRDGHHLVDGGVADRSGIGHGLHPRRRAGRTCARQQRALARPRGRRPATTGALLEPAPPRGDTWRRLASRRAS